MKILCIQGAELFSASINRPNLFYEVYNPIM
jgi:superfamily II DNA helicase RecQ